MCEKYGKGKGLSESKGGYWMYEISKTEDKPRYKRLGVSKTFKIKDYVTDF